MSTVIPDTAPAAPWVEAALHGSCSATAGPAEEQVCTRCQEDRLPAAYRGDVHASEGHFDGRYGDVTGVALPERFAVTLDGQPVDLDNTLAVYAGAPGWIVQDINEPGTCPRCKCPWPLVLVRRGEVRVSGAAPRLRG